MCFQCCYHEYYVSRSVVNGIVLEHAEANIHTEQRQSLGDEECYLKMLNCHDSVHNKYLEGELVLVEWEGKVLA